MAQYDELVSVLRHLLTEKFSPKPSFTRGLLGDGNGNVQVPGRPDKSFVRFNRGSTEFFEIFNKTVTPVNDWPVLIGEIPWQPGLTQVVDTDWSAFEQSGWGDNLGNTSPHAPTHEWPDGAPGSDPVNVHLRSIVPGRAYVAGTGSTTIFVNSLEYESQATGTVWPGTPGVDLSPVMGATATGTMRFAGIYIDPALNSLAVVTGTTTVHSGALTPPLVSFPQGVVPATRIKIYGNQTAISEADIFDARRPFNSTVERTLTAGQNINLPNDGAKNLTIDTVLKVKNTSGVTAVANDLGQIDEAGEFKLSTATAQTTENWCVVITGGANNADIYVARRGRVTVAYTSTAPSAGNYLVTSGTAGDAQQQTTMHPAIFAVCTANGAGGTVEALLLCNRTQQQATSNYPIFQMNNYTGSNFTATIAAVSGASVEYTITGGTNEDSIVPSASSHLSKIVLHNTTRGDSALIDSVSNTNTGTPADGTITLIANAPGGWAITDVITTRSQTNTGVTGSSNYFFDLDFDNVDNITIPKLATLSYGELTFIDSGAPAAAAVKVILHPYEADLNAKRVAIYAPDPGSRILTAVPLIDNIFCMACDATGSGTGVVVFRTSAVVVASP